MPMTTVNARIYIARVLGGAASPNIIDLADEALRRGYSDWQTMRNWDFLLKDNSQPTLVASVTCTNGSAVITPPTAGYFDFVNAGQGVTVSSGTATLAAGTTVLSYVRGADGSITSVTLSNNFGGTTGACTLSFSAYLHVTGGVNDYSLPTDCYELYTARFITNSKRPLRYKNQRVWDYTQWDQTVHGTPCEYTQYSPYAPATQNHGTEHLKFDVVPDQADDVLLRYYRKFIVDGTYVDVHDKFLYAFLDHCRGRALEAKRAQENPQEYMQSVAVQSEKSGESEEEKEDDDDNYMKSQFEQGSTHNRPIVGNGDFWPTMW
jgi:hypothetical protein